MAKKVKKVVVSVAARKSRAPGRRRRKRVGLVRNNMSNLTQFGGEYVRCALGLGNETNIGIPDKVTDPTFSIMLKLSQEFTFGNDGTLYLAFVPGLNQVLHVASESGTGGATFVGTVYNIGTGQYENVNFNLGAGTSTTDTYYPHADLTGSPWLGLPFFEFQVGDPRVVQASDSNNLNFYATDWRPVAIRAKIIYGGTDLSNSGFIASCSGIVQGTAMTQAPATAIPSPLYGEGIVQYQFSPSALGTGFSSVASAMDGSVCRLKDGLEIQLRPTDPDHEFMTLAQGFIPVFDNGTGATASNVALAQLGINPTVGGNSVPQCAILPPCGKYGGMDVCVVAISGATAGQTVTVVVESCVEMKVSRVLGLARHMAKASPEYDPTALAVVAEVQKRSPIATPGYCKPTQVAFQNIAMGGGSFAGALERVVSTIAKPFAYIGSLFDKLGGPVKVAKGALNMLGGPFAAAGNSLLESGRAMGMLTQ